jgi:hypothetical protein
MSTHTQQAVFGASVLVPLRRRKTTPVWPTQWLADASRVVAASVRRIFLTPVEVARPPRKSNPERYKYLERSLMAREMDRL